MLLPSDIASADAAPARTRAREWLSRARTSHLWLWLAFAFVHVGLGALVLSLDQQKYLGDVHTIYLPWAHHVLAGHGIVGIDSRWVYPIAALVPVLAPMLFGAAAYGFAWIVMVTGLNAAAIAMLTHRPSRRRWSAAWWWLAFLLLLGPIALTRIDTVSVPIAIAGLLWLSTRPRVAIVLLTIATWIKVWPVALLASLLLDARHRLRTIVIAVVTSAAIVAIPLALGAGTRLFSFIGTQDARGLQIESPVATGWLWAAALHVHPSHVFYSRALNTFEVSGPGTQMAAHLMTPLLFLALVTVMALGLFAAMRHDAKALPALMLAMVLALMLFDKVLSPQYITWLAAPIVYGLVRQPRRFRFPAFVGLAVAALTQAFYPWIYNLVIDANPAAIALLASRNLALCVLFAWAIVRLCRARSRATDAASRATGGVAVETAIAG
ncbi:hypothetical protein GCM10028798_23330 [Humibacter antri]